MIYPILLAGGSGTRLWPLSRKSYPKQFAPLFEGETLFQRTAERLSGPLFAPLIVMTAADFRFIAAEQLDTAGIAGATLYLEPQARNTAPSIVTAALAMADTPDAVLLFAPADHLITDVPAFHAALAAGRSAAEAGAIVTFGIAPTHAETGYGYLELDRLPGAETGPLPLEAFAEKPDAATARAMVDSGRYLWNAGIFMARVDTLLAAAETHAPELMAPCRKALATARQDMDFTRLGDAFAEADSISVDYAIMEKAQGLQVVPFAGGWSDMGGWRAVKEAMSDPNGNAVTGKALALDCSNSLLRSEDGGPRLVGLGLTNIAAVAMGDAVLVMPMDRAEDVKSVVAALKDAGAPEAEGFTRMHRPWGYYESLSMGARFQVKRIVVKPGAALSLQSHMHRSEHWVVVAGSAKVTVDDKIRLMGENESVYIPLGAIHRLENPGKMPMVLIEVQTGTYLGEDDIIRYEDIYDRAGAETAA